MKTTLRSKTKEISIDNESSVVIIGEKINPTGHKKLAIAFKEANLDYVEEVASLQIASGADVLDINVGMPSMDEVSLLPEIVQLIQSVSDAPICLDSANPAALAAGLAVIQGKPLINSVTGEEDSLNAILPLVRDYGTAVIGLTMDDAGIPNTAEKRVNIARKIIERAAGYGIEPQDIVIDPLVMTVGADSQAGVITLHAIERIQQEFGVNINLGASNISFGLPERQVINKAFLALAIGVGASCVITNPMTNTLAIRAIDLLLGRDDYGSRYIKQYRYLSKK